MKSIIRPDYHNSILNVSNSLLKHYGAPTHYDGQQDLDIVLAKKYKHIAVFLIDAMGYKIIDQHLKPNSFFHVHNLKTMTTVCPSTTSAATTAFLSGLSPLQTGWFGWQQYFDNYQRHVILFKNQDYYTSEFLNINVLKDDLPYENIFAQIKKASPEVQMYTSIFENRKRKFLHINELVRLVKRNFRKKEVNFTYAYYTELDSLMHEVGPGHRQSRRLISRIERRIASLKRKMKDDCLVIVIADHGQTKVEDYNVFDHKELLATISGKPGIEGRFATFNVINVEGFIKYYKDNLSEFFDLYTKQEVLDNHFFGPESETKHERFFGNYFLLAKDKYIISYHEEPINMHIGHHAGMSEEEMLIPLIVF